MAQPAISSVRVSTRSLPICLMDLMRLPFEGRTEKVAQGWLLGG